MSNYAIIKEVDAAMDDVLERLPGILQAEGFGILSRIPIHEKLKEKLGVDFRRYEILGVCNPPNAYKALQAEENIGLMLPCNMVVYERGGKTVVAAIRPSAAMTAVGNQNLNDVAREVEEKLARVIEGV